MQAASLGWLHCQVMEVSPNCASPEMWSSLPSTSDARATVGAHAACHAASSVLLFKVVAARRVDYESPLRGWDLHATVSY